jgi:BirA family transcriptional regulator, biotin operon repressor / biotin---[acetyl-CoA-carboxylase] ligase
MTPAPDPRPPLDPTRLPPGVEVVEEADSTNSLVTKRAREGAAHGLVVVAEHQTSGRGRLDRSWEVPPRAALTFSMLVRPDLPAESWPWLPLLTGYAVHAALVDRVPELGLKWPNDVLVDDKKLAGILVERVDTPTGPAAVLGIGINVLQEQSDLPIPEATSLLLQVEGRPDRTEVLDAVLGSLKGLLPLLEDTEALRRAYAGECVTLGRTVRVDVPAGEPISGRAVDIDPGGRLVVATESGEVAVGAGDVIHVRPADL